MAEAGAVTAPAAADGVERTGDSESRKNGPPAASTDASASTPAQAATQTAALLSKSMVLDALKAAISLRQGKRQVAHEQYQHYHSFYVGSLRKHQRAKATVQRAIKEVFRVRRRAARRILDERAEEQQRLEREAAAEAYKNRAMHTVKTRGKHMSAIIRPKRAHMVLWPVQLRHPAFYKRRNVRDLSTRWNHPQAHPASFHLVSPSAHAVQSAMHFAEATGRSLDLPPTKSRVTEVHRDLLLNAEVFHPASVSLPDTVPTIRRRTHDPAQINPVFWDYKLHVVPPGVAAVPPAGTIVHAAKLTWTWGAPLTDGGARITNTQVRVLPWTDEQQPRIFEGLVTSFTTADWFPGASKGGEGGGGAVARPVTPGVDYVLRVRFCNKAGWGPWTAAYDPARSPAVNTRVVFFALVSCNTLYPAMLSQSKIQSDYVVPLFDLPLALRNDAVEIHRALGHPCYGYLPEDQLQLHLDLTKDAFRERLLAFCRQASTSPLADRATVTIYVSGQSCHLPDQRPTIKRKRELVKKSGLCSEWSTYLLLRDATVTGRKREAFEAEALSELELAEILREQLHVHRCCIVLDLTHNHGMWRDTNGKKKLLLAGVAVGRNPHPTFMQNLEKMLSVTEQKRTWRDRLRAAHQDYVKAVRRPQPPLRPYHTAARRTTPHHPITLGPRLHRHTRHTCQHTHQH
jgi:hypothetical protein